MRFGQLIALLALCTFCSAHGLFGFKEPKAVAQKLHYDNGVVNLDALNEQLAHCDVVKQLSMDEIEHEHSAYESVAKMYAWLFPFGPAGNAVLATLYISGPPNLLLGLIPADIKVSSLSLLVGFATGGLLGDVFLHLLPQTFFGESVEEGVSFVLIDEKRNCVLGLCIFLGFLIFFVIDKSLRVLEHTGEASLSHSHTHSTVEVPVVETKKKGRKPKSKKKEAVPVVANPNASVKTSAYLNLISDFCHNITDGLAISASFYISRSVGCTTTLAVFFHEIPHEIGDFALLIQGGFTKWQAMGFQFVTAVGAFLGTFIGVAIQESGKESVAALSKDIYNGILGTTVEVGDLTLPFTAGGFLYIATVGVIPELLQLEAGTTRCQELVKSLQQLFFIGVGISVMFAIAWFE